MTLNVTGLRNLPFPNTSEKYHSNDFDKKPIEIYVFIDPICPLSWSVEPYLKKLSFEFGRFFTIRPIISTSLNMATMQSVGNISTLKRQDDQATNKQKDNTILFPSLVILAIKAAELQGNNPGRIFLRKLQEKIFLKREMNIDLNLLIKCAIEAELDILEFKKDLYSTPARSAFQCDLRLTEEMNVLHTPTIVFLNQRAEEDGIKVSGVHSYDVYLHILSEMLQKHPIPTTKPSVEEFLALFGASSNHEISIMYDWTIPETVRFMKKLQLKQKVKRIVQGSETFWKFLY